VVVTVSRQLREFTPQRAPIVSKRLLDGSTLAGRPPALAERGLPELAERRDGLEVALIGRSRPPQDRAHRVGLDAGASGLGRAAAQSCLAMSAVARTSRALTASGCRRSSARSSSTVPSRSPIS